MAKKSKVKPKLKSKAKSAAKPKVKPRIKSAAKPKVKPRIKSAAKPKATPKSKAKVMTKTKLITKKVAVKAASPRSKVAVKELPAAVLNRAVIKHDVRTLVSSAPAAKAAGSIVKRNVNPMVERRRPVKRPTRVNQFSFMKAPGLEHAFEVGGGVEVFCDHEKSKERIRGWVKGIVVQVDNKMVAVQFRSNVYLTDGWMVPDRILWFPLNSEHMRLIPGKKPVTKDLIPDY
jgi:hypothetical protein